MGEPKSCVCVCLLLVEIKTSAADQVCFWTFTLCNDEALQYNNSVCAGLQQLLTLQTGGRTVDPRSESLLLQVSEVHLIASCSVHGVNRLSEQVQGEDGHTLRLDHRGTGLEPVLALPGKNTTVVVR